ncbi:MAG: hypothetical protein MH825_07470 [Cyanobacteria bacterium]|nr:hypothetical protein [Cyanobacteriota bacterium]
MALLTLEISLEILLQAIAHWDQGDRLQLWKFLSEDLFSVAETDAQPSPADDLRQALQEMRSGQTFPIEQMWLAVEID